MSLNIAIIGCGLIGHKRARALKNANLVACVDIVKERAETLARAFAGAAPLTDWRAIADRRDVDAVIISTTNNMLAEISITMLSAGKPVLVEKPAARSAMELEPVVQVAKKTQTVARVGFNHRYHRAFRKARELFESGALGDLMFVRGRYGHGGRLGYEKEWRANPQLSGGGELIDQGVHLIDLARWFLGDLSDAQGFAHTFYWDMPVDDNGFMLLRTPKNQVAFLHVSCTEWKNTFSFEIYGRNAKLDINGLGGSYGMERLTYYRLLPQMGPPETTIWEYPMEDNSWEVEFADFQEDIRLHRQPSANLGDAQAALQIVDRLYKVSLQ